jgi:hypothetical protein
MSSGAFVFPYVVAALGLLLLSAMRAWKLVDRNADWLLAVLLSFTAALIGGMLDLGTDVEGYRTYYEDLPHLQELYTWWDAGFEAMALLFAHAGAPYGAFVFFCILSSHLIKLHVFHHATPNSLLGFFAIFCLNFGEVGFVRQYLAASILLLTFHFLTRRRIAAALFTALLAGLIHKTAFIATVVMFVVYFGVGSLMPLAALASAAIALTFVLPSGILGSLQNRVAAQVAVYLAEGYVQGLQEGGISLVRNTSKFLLYIALALWMLRGASKAGAESVQRISGRFVISLSLFGLLLTATLSPVFSRLSVYVFPFLALSFRADLFQPRYSQLPDQFAVGVLLIINLLVSLYPLSAYF